MEVSSERPSVMSWRQLLPSYRGRLEKTYSDLVTKIACVVPQVKDLIRRLESLAEAVTELPGVTGAIFLSFDKAGFALAYGAKNFEFCEEMLPLKVLDDISSALADEDKWLDVQMASLSSPRAHLVRARKIEDEREDLGFMLVGFAENAEVAPVLEILDRLMAVFKWVLEDALKLEEMRLIEELRELELENLGRKEPIDPQTIAKLLNSIFSADAVTILFLEHERLYLSATTDDELRKDVVTYEPRAGLTGYIASTGKPLRLRNALDPSETKLESGGEYIREKPLHPERISKSGDPVRLLGVPMRSGGKIRGVIRILRVERRAPFSAAEQNALQHFANLLGLAMHSAWRLLLSKSVMWAETEAICITRNEPARGEAVPRVVIADPGAVVLFGLAMDDLIGSDARKLYHGADYNKVREHLERLISGEKSESESITIKVNRFNRPGDEVRTVTISYRLVTSPFVVPKTYYTVAVIYDVTETQLRSEQHERLVKLLDKEGLAYFLTDEKGRTRESSPAESRLTGYKSDELIGMEREDLYPEPLDRRALLNEADRKGGRLVFTTQRLKRKDGGLFWAEGAIHVLKDKEGRKIGYEGLYEDVTDRLRLQGFLDLDTQEVVKERELYRELESNVRFQLLFMTSVSHQLRSPLGALIGQLVNFQKGIVDVERFSSRLTYVIGQAKVCALLVENLTYMDKILRGESFDFQRVNLGKLAIETKLNFAHLLPKRKLVILVGEKSIKKNLRVWGHRELLRQVLVNLIDNAIKYSLPGSPVVIRGRHDRAGRYLQVSNRGIPIPKEIREKIFDRGFRTAEAEERVPDGTGLGLWLVRKICAAHDARIRCVEILEEGEERTAFQIFFSSSELRRSVSGRRS